MVNGHREHQPFVLHHDRAVLVPVRVLTRSGPVVIHKILDDRVVRVGGDRAELGLPFQYDVRAAARATDVQAGSRIAAQVLRLGPVVGE